MNGDETEPSLAPVPITMCRTALREVWVWVANVIQIVLFVWLAAKGINYIIPPLAIGTCIIVMSYITTLILFFCGGLNAFVLVVSDFHHAVLVNRIRGYKAPKNDREALTLKKSRTLEEITSGLHAKFFWQSPVFIDLRRIAIMGTSVTTYSADQIEQVIKWEGIVGPIPGWLCNLVRISAGAGHRIIQAKTEGGLGEMVNGIEHEDINRRQVDLSGAFQGLYGGDGNASWLESSLGLGVKMLTITEVNRNKSFQKSAELPERTRKTATAVKVLINASKVNGRPTLSAKEALQAIMAQGDDAEMIVYQGLENMGGSKLMLPLGGHKKNRGGENE